MAAVFRENARERFPINTHPSAPEHAFRLNWAHLRPFTQPKTAAFLLFSESSHWRAKISAPSGRVPHSCGERSCYTDAILFITSSRDAPVIMLWFGRWKVAESARWAEKSGGPLRREQQTACDAYDGRRAGYEEKSASFSANSYAAPSEVRERDILRTLLANTTD